MDNYQVATGQRPIIHAADINTFGLAASKAIVVDVSDGKPSVTVAHSVDATGDIAKQTIGFAAGLGGMRLSIFTHINLIGSDDERKREAQRLNAVYVLDGGPAGRQEFDNPLKVVSPDFRIVDLHKVIDLIQ